MSTIKLVEFEGKEITTLSELTAAGGTACVPEGAYLSDVVKAKFPGVSYSYCPSPDVCIERLKGGVCQLYADDGKSVQVWNSLPETLPFRLEPNLAFIRDLDRAGITISSAQRFQPRSN